MPPSYSEFRNKPFPVPEVFSSLLYDFQFFTLQMLVQKSLHHGSVFILLSCPELDSISLQQQ
jgi:hypothetical protein